MKALIIEKIEREDVNYTYEKLEFSKNKKRNMEYWDMIDSIAEDALNSAAAMVGITNIEWNEFDDIKEVTDLLVKLIESKFEVKFPYVDEDY